VSTNLLGSNIYLQVYMNTCDIVKCHCNTVMLNITTVSLFLIIIIIIIIATVLTHTRDYLLSNRIRLAGIRASYKLTEHTIGAMLAQQTTMP